MYRRAWVLVAVLALLTTSLVDAHPFDNPPGIDPLVPPGGWVTDFPYPRNIFIDFATDPGNWDPDPIQGVDLLPDVTCIIEGTEDPSLYPSDWCDWAFQLDWIDTDPGLPGRQGLIGIDNRENASVELIWHLDSLPPGPFTHMWIEIEYLQLGTGDWTGGISPYPLDARAREEFVDPTNQLWQRLNWWALLGPHPRAEEVGLMFTTDTFEPGTFLIDHIHIATEVTGDIIPEPVSCVVFGAGLVGLAARRRRRAK